VPSFSLRNPHIVIVGALIISILGATAFTRMPVDVFPTLHMPAVIVATFYPGMPPMQIEADITTRFERFFTLGSGIKYIQSRSVPGVSIIKVFFHRNINVYAAAASLSSLAMADLRHMPPGTLPPLVLPAGASSLPVVLVTVSGKGYNQTELRDQAQYNIRNWLATVSGTSVPPPFGGKYRQIMAYVNRDALQARGLSLMDVVHALNSANLIIPAGDAKIGDTDYFIYSNAMIEHPKNVNNVPVKIGKDGEEPVLVRDIGHAEDAAEIQLNVVRINGQRSVYIPVLKQGGANTISIVDGVRALLPKIPLPKGMKLKAIFDQSVYVRRAMSSLEHEAASGAVLASLMILIFLGSFRSTIAIFLSIPLSILAGLFGLHMNGSTINIMTLGGFALAIGRLVDNSVIVLENIDRHLVEGKAPAQAARDGAEEVALSVLAITITTCVVFFPVMFLFGVAKYLFSALALAVVLAIAASYVIAMTIIPLYCAHFLDADEARAEETGELRRGVLGVFMRAYERFAKRYERFLDKSLNHKFIVIAGASGLFVASLIMFPMIGTELFPRTDSGTFIINYHGPLGMRIELTEELTARLENLIHQVIPKDELSQIVSNIGLAPGFSAIFSPNASSDSGLVMVELKANHKVPTFAYIKRLKRLIAQRLPEMHVFFSSGSIIDSVLDNGLAAPIDIQFSGPDYSPLFHAARTAQEALSSLPQISETFIPEEADYPTLDIDVDRVKAARLGLSEKNVVDNVITALTSNVMIAPSIWIDPKTGNDYFLTAQYQEKNINSLQTLKNIPVRSGKPGTDDALLLRNVAKIKREREPAEADHYNIQRVVDLYVNPRTSNLGGAQSAIERVLRRVRLPQGVSIAYRGPVKTMRASFASMGFGLVIASLLVYLVMVAQFRSFLDPFIVMFAVPMGLIGVVWILLLTGTTLNIESFMGIIYMVGIAVSNAILLVDFANQRFRHGEGLRRAVVESSRIRLRPILITALATVVGLLPIALTSDASAPLARAAIGGLTVSTFLTLFLVPSGYELFYSRLGKDN
jgi:multidrug efflux pump subunit AcrB